MDAQVESFPIMLYRRFSNGETVEELAAELGIPEDRVERRLRAAALCLKRRETSAGLLALHASLARG